MHSAAELLHWEQSHGHRFTHDFFKFPGKFHPPVVENVLRRLSPRAVVDPMAGVGTVGVEAKVAGVPALLVDIDPVSCFFSKVKTSPLSEVTLQQAWRTLRRSYDAHRRPANEIARLKFEDVSERLMKKALRENGSENLARLTYWFRRYVLADYARLDHAINGHGLPGRGSKVRAFFRACLLSSIRRISNADPSPVSGVEITRAMRDRIEKGYEIDVFGEYERRVELNLARMAEYVEYLKSEGTLATPVHVIRDDCLNLRKYADLVGNEVDLVFFSPPYCNAIEYWRRHRLEYLLGGFLSEEEIITHSTKFVGRTSVGRSRRFRAPPPGVGHSSIDEVLCALAKEGRVRKAWQLQQYFTAMEGRLHSFADLLPKAGHVVIIVGDSRTGGYKIPTAEVLAHLGERIGLRHVETVSYPIKNRSMQFPLKTGEQKISHESIIVLSKPDARLN